MKQSTKFGIIIKKMTRIDILNQENKLYKAMKESNIEILEELLHDDLLFITPGGDVITKQIDLQNYRDSHMKIHELIPNVENLNIINDLAVITLMIELKGSYQNKEFNGKFRYIRFWKAFSTGIKVVGGSGMIINA